MDLHSSELVRDALLTTIFLEEAIQHISYGERRKRIEETWAWQKELGRGSYGRVWLEKSQEQGRVRAVKEIRKHAGPTTPILYERELEAICKFSQLKYRRCFVRSYGWFENQEFVFIAMEYFELGDLRRYLNRPFEEATARNVTFQLLGGLQYMHENGYVHRDLKPGNILVASAAPNWSVRIADFGISKRVAGDSTAFRTVIGTIGYMAPEIHGLYHKDDPARLARQSRSGNDELVYTPAVDVWALGAIVFEMLTVTRAFEEIRDLLNYAVYEGSFPKEPLEDRGVTSDCVNFVESVMASIPSRRPCANDAEQHPWMKEEHSSAVLVDHDTELTPLHADESSNQHFDSPPDLAALSLEPNASRDSERERHANAIKSGQSPVHAGHHGFEPDAEWSTSQSYSSTLLQHKPPFGVGRHDDSSHSRSSNTEKNSVSLRPKRLRIHMWNIVVAIAILERVSRRRVQRREGYRPEEHIYDPNHTRARKALRAFHLSAHEEAELSYRLVRPLTSTYSRYVREEQWQSRIEARIVQTHLPPNLGPLRSCIRYYSPSYTIPSPSSDRLGRYSRREVLSSSFGGSVVTKLAPRGNGPLILAWEALALLRLKHDNIVKIRDIIRCLTLLDPNDEDDSPSDYYGLVFNTQLTGIRCVLSLRKYLDSIPIEVASGSLSRSERLMPKPRVTHLVEQLLSAVAYLVENNITHNRICPQSIFVKCFGRAQDLDQIIHLMLGDFEDWQPISEKEKLTSQASSPKPKTVPPSRPQLSDMERWIYSPPEKWDRANVWRPSAFTDSWSCGLIMVELRYKLPAVNLAAHGWDPTAALNSTLLPFCFEAMSRKAVSRSLLIINPNKRIDPKSALARFRKLHPH